MNLKPLFGFLFLLIVVGLLAIYWFFPLDSTFFIAKTKETNFSLDNLTNMQFYKNMRFPESKISYKIEDNCTLQKKEDMKRGFAIVENLTILDFYPVDSDEEITVSCVNKNIHEGELFIAGEGGPTNITKDENFNVIFKGTILLIKNSKCPKPNIAMHELFHVLGFNHSKNSNNLMYPISKCNQEISQDMIDLINELYSIPSYADVVFRNVSATLNGRYLNTNFTIWNYGLKDSDSIKLKLYADEKLIKSTNISPMEIGSGKSLFLKNIFVSQLNVNELRYVLETNFLELDKENNIVVLEIKK